MMMMMMMNEQSELIYQVLRYIHSSVLFIRRDNSDSETGKNTWTDV